MYRVVNRVMSGHNVVGYLVISDIGEDRIVDTLQFGALVAEGMVYNCKIQGGSPIGTNGFMLRELPSIKQPRPGEDTFRTPQNKAQNTSIDRSIAFDYLMLIRLVKFQPEYEIVGACVILKEYGKISKAQISLYEIQEMLREGYTGDERIQKACRLANTRIKEKDLGKLSLNYKIAKTFRSLMEREIEFGCQAENPSIQLRTLLSNRYKILEEKPLILLAEVKFGTTGESIQGTETFAQTGKTIGYIVANSDYYGYNVGNYFIPGNGVAIIGTDCMTDIIYNGLENQIINAEQITVEAKPRLRSTRQKIAEFGIPDFSTMCTIPNIKATLNKHTDIWEVQAKDLSGAENELLPDFQMLDGSLHEGKLEGRYGSKSTMEQDEEFIKLLKATQAEVQAEQKPDPRISRVSQQGLKGLMGMFKKDKR